MALQLTQAFPNGFSGDYWKISNIQIDWLNQRSTVSLLLYKDKDTREAHLTDGMIGQVQRNWNDTNFPFTSTEDIRTTAYSKLKTDQIDDNGNSNPFLNATDI